MNAMNNYEKDKSGFRKSFIIWGLGSIITLYVFMRLIGGFMWGVSWGSDLAISSMEEEILDHALREDGEKTNIDKSFIGLVNVKSYGRQNHLFYVSDYRGNGPSYIMIQTSTNFHRDHLTGTIYSLPFKDNASKEGLRQAVALNEGWYLYETTDEEALKNVIKIKSSLEG